MNFHIVLNAVLFMAGLGLLLAVIIAFANKKLSVEEDPRIDDVEELLPGSNCGACGLPGCRAFAEAVVNGIQNPSSCTVSSNEQRAEVASYLGVELGNVAKRVARLACGGGSHVAKQRAKYQGLKSCRAAAITAGGGKGCAWGCLGLGDCEVVCEFEAISFSPQGLPIVDVAKCTACGDCVDICPKTLFSIQKVSEKLWVNCKNLEFGDKAEVECEVACTACGKCVMDAGGELIQIKNNLATVNYALNDFSQKQMIQRCPTGAITWVHEDGEYEQGQLAKRIIRKRALPLG